MRERMAMQGVLLVGLSALALWAIVDWQIGPEFWPAVPLFALLGVFFIGEAIT